MNPEQHAGGDYESASINFTSLNNNDGESIPLTPRVKAHGKIDQYIFLTTSVNTFHGNIIFLYPLKIPENHPVDVYLFKVNNRNTRNRREICSKLSINTPERRQ